MAETSRQHARLRKCGFSDYLIKALIADGYADPRRLLTASWREIQLIVNVGEIGLAQIAAYRARNGITPPRPSPR